MHWNIFARIREGPDWPYIEVFDWERTTPSSHLFPGVKTFRILILTPLAVD